MSLRKAFYDSVKNGNILRVHIMMKDSLLTDPTFEDFDAMEQAAQNMGGTASAARWPAFYHRPQPVEH